MQVLMDTGPWVALIDRSETRHGECVEWLRQKYYDLPMDFADATIVCLAQDLAIKRVATFDKKDFSIYRLPGKRPFIIFP